MLALPGKKHEPLQPHTPFVFCVCTQLKAGYKQGRLFFSVVYKYTKRSCPALWTFVFTHELYQPGREACPPASSDDTGHTAEASGFSLEQMICVHGHRYLRS